MKVYRIAHESDVENGPYRGRISVPVDLGLHFMASHRPHPIFVKHWDFAHAGGFDKEALAEMLFGFKTLTQAKKWFGKKGLKELDGLGFRLYTIEVPWVVLSEKQLVMPKAHIEILSTKPLTEI